MCSTYYIANRGHFFSAYAALVAGVINLFYKFVRIQCLLCQYALGGGLPNCVLFASVGGGGQKRPKKLRAHIGMPPEDFVAKCRV